MDMTSKTVEIYTDRHGAETGLAFRVVERIEAEDG
jgi:hypothetical protein